MEFISWLKCSLTTWPWRTPALKSFGFPSGGTFFWNLIMELRTLNYLKELFSIWFRHLQCEVHDCKHLLSIYSRFNIQLRMVKNGKIPTSVFSDQDVIQRVPASILSSGYIWSEFHVFSWSADAKLSPGCLESWRDLPNAFSRKVQIERRVKMCWSCLLVGKIF